MNTYFETSALIKLLIREDGTDEAARIWDASDLVATSRLTYPEAKAALAAAGRNGRLTTRQLSDAKDALEDRLHSTELVEVTDAIARAAGNLAEDRSLRGYDAVHLASAMSLQDVVLVSWDRELGQAAKALGLATAGITP